MFDVSSIGSSLSARLAAVRFSRTSLWTGFKVLLAVILVGMVAGRISLADLFATWQSISLWWLVVGFATYSAITFGAARRYWLLIARQIPFPPMVMLVILQTVLSNLVATSAGAVSFVALLRGKYHVRATQGVSSLLLGRIGDLVVLWVALVMLSGLLWEAVSPLHRALAVLIVSLGVVLVLCTLAVVGRRFIATPMEKFMRMTGLERVSVCARVLQRVRALADIPNNEITRLMMPVAVWSVIIFGLNFIFAYVSMLMFHVTISPVYLLFVVVLTQFVLLIPIQVFGGLGVYELSAIYLYSLFGMEPSLMTPIVLGWRIVFYAFNLLLLVYLPFVSRFAALPDEMQASNAGI